MIARQGCAWCVCVKGEHLRGYERFEQRVQAAIYRCIEGRDKKKMKVILNFIMYLCIEGQRWASIVNLSSQV